MIKILSLLLAFILTALPVMAQEDDLVQKDSVYYTMDDGIMTPQEMEEESNHVFRMCDQNHFQKNNFKCDCLAGAFLLEREKQGPMVAQHKILQDITINKPVACANTEKIAGDSYEACMQLSARRSLKGDNPQYCECVANKIANDFTAKPRLVAGYLQTLTFNARIYCDKPENKSK